MGHEDLVIIGRVTGALVIGAMIGFERTFHGRPAGFRTHALVCIASAVLMIVTVYQNQWMTEVAHEAIRTTDLLPGRDELQTDLIRTTSEVLAASKRRRLLTGGGTLTHSVASPRRTA